MKYLVLAFLVLFAANTCRHAVRAEASRCRTDCRTDSGGNVHCKTVCR